MRVGGQRHAAAALPSGNRSGTHYIRDWVGPKIGLDGAENFALHRLRVAISTELSRPETIPKDVRIDFLKTVLLKAIIV
jgi:hypothetical protein